MLQLSEATALRIKELMQQTFVNAICFGKEKRFIAFHSQYDFSGKNAGQNRHDDIEYLPGLRD